MRSSDADHRVTSRDRVFEKVLSLSRWNGRQHRKFLAAHVDSYRSRCFSRFVISFYLLPSSDVTRLGLCVYKLREISALSVL
jgi:hypothetical protein